MPESTGAFSTDFGNVVTLGLALAGTSSLGDSIADPGAEVLGAFEDAGAFVDDAGGSEDGSFAVAEVDSEELSLPGTVRLGLAESVGPAALLDALALGSTPVLVAAGVRAATLNAMEAPTSTTMTASAQASHFLFCIFPHQCDRPHPGCHGHNPNIPCG
ncbi:hypothetical protein [Paeniglutamicibacter psychrophenolicus]|uniref:hypothetical protein n=1 Tax=Paeniglutamicibacter psychrophenolicus TaxID=257454 RepID=UPI0027812BED|nr:hypothetical protein [Paeniglutamicibacter psychrophenolicus]MDQ0092553.1 hypothetical protein [Paeniglutamicibacter psychrophenolicus]